MQTEIIWQNDNDDRCLATTSASAIDVVDVLDAETGRPAQVDLGTQAAKINAAVAAADGAARSAVQHALLAGNLLIEAKAKIAHGAWEKWIVDNCTVAPRTARAYMQIAEKHSSLDKPERQRVADLPLREAIKAITTPAKAPKHSTASWNDPKEIARRTVSYEVGNTFQRGSLALKRAAKELQCMRDLKPSQSSALRKHLTRALQDLDRLYPPANSIDSANSASYAGEAAEQPKALAA